MVVNMKKNRILIAIGILGIFLLSAFLIRNPTVRPIPLCPKQLGREGMPSMPNPAAVYCKSLGYKYENGTCEFPDATECDGWEFFTGKCGKKWTYCERYGNGKIEITREGCAFSQECGLCILPDGTKCREWDYCSGECP
ncbi:MAG: hypothetical protein DRO94_02395 [Candidatus Altiarchaeales archaeon]|nr:MAG: hypothetical protein DRO95_04490 [Candidatus Altiarchaeales archaeon]RLI94627.1 MAG: hypothetical protein DRO94_02395 [Candidatus Altiarchaeales archaeon]HDO82053.1 DUF333 domain-containing protein [Candidatus Altiarchaeales archaeon]HEX54702.1 DUF333 domain-containing protein [Candidatus Altiarchaeales archaeon]